MQRYPLVFTHANGFTGESYKSVLAPLAQEFDVHAIPKLGHDPLYPVSNNWPKLVEEYLHTIKQFGEPIIAVGHSLGGMISIMAASQAPQYFRAVVALDPPIMLGGTGFILGLAKSTGFADKLTPGGKAAVRRKSWASHDEMTQHLSKRTLFRNFTHDAMQDYVVNGTRPTEQGSVELIFDPEVEASIFRSLPHNGQRYLKKLKVPMRLIAGKESDLMIPSRVKLIRSRGVEVMQVPGGHMFPFEHPQETQQAIKQAIHDMLGDNA